MTNRANHGCFTGRSLLLDGLPMLRMAVTQVGGRAATATVAQHICMLIQYSITRGGPTRLAYPNEDYASQPLIFWTLMIVEAA